MNPETPWTALGFIFRSLPGVLLMQRDLDQFGVVEAADSVLLSYYRGN